MQSSIVKDYMNPAPVTVGPDCSVVEAAQIILKNKVSGTIVIDSEKNYIGMLSELDCLKAMSNALYNEGRSNPSIKVEDVMKKDTSTSSPNDALFDTVKKMLEEGQRRRPVVENNKLVGMVSCRQMLKAINNYA